MEWRNSSVLASPARVISSLRQATAPTKSIPGASRWSRPRVCSQRGSVFGWKLPAALSRSTTAILAPLYRHVARLPGTGGAQPKSSPTAANIAPRCSCPQSGSEQDAPQPTAPALAPSPRLLLMDEPFAALDEMSRDHLNEELLRLRAEQQWAAVFVTHSVAEAVFLSTRIIVLAPNPGRVYATLPIDLPRER